MTITSNTSTINVSNSNNPIVFLNMTEINNIKNNRQTEITNFINGHVIGTGDKAMNKSLQSVTYGGPDPLSGHTTHDFRTIVDNLNCIGQYDYCAMTTASDAIRNLGLAYILKNDTIYAKKAIQHIFNFCIKKETYMSSYIGTNMDAVRIWIKLPGLIYGASLTWDYISSTDGWNQNYNNGIVNTTYANHFRNWVASFRDSIKAEPEYGEELPFWRTMNIAVTSAFLNDTTNLTYAFNRWRELIGLKIGTGNPCPSPCSSSCDDNNLIVPILPRTTSLSYSTFALQAMGLTAEIAKHYPNLGYNLYTWKTSDGRGIETVWDRMAPYVVDWTKWINECPKCRQDGGLDAGQDVWTYELAYSQFQKQPYKDVLLHWNSTRPRPSYYDFKLLGPITLTHGTTF